MKKSLLVMALFSSSIFAACPTTQDDLIISEYVEGSSFNKALEIFNGTGASIDLTLYEIRIYFNGASVSTNYSLTGPNLAGGSTYVLAHLSAALGAVTVNQSGGGFSWNGNDSIELGLIVGSTVVDSIGDVGNVAVFASNTTLRRVMTTCGGDTVSNNGFDATKWVSFASNTFDDLGANGTMLLPVELTNFSVE